MMRSAVATTLALSLAVAVGAGPGSRDATAACAPPTKSTAYDPSPGGATNYVVANDIWIAQSFTVPSSTTLNKVALYLRQTGGMGDSITVEVQGDSGGEPNGTVLGRHARILSNTAPEFAEFDFSSDNISLAAGRRYQLVARNTSAVADGYDWGGYSPGDYPDGDKHESQNQGTTWIADTGDDQLFQVFGHTCTADTQQQQQQTNNAPPLASVSGLGFSHTAFAAESSGPSAYSAKKKTPAGTKVSFQLNEAATVRFTVTRRAKGRKVKRGKKTRCVKPTHKNRKRRRCTRVVTLKGSFTRNGVAGKNSFHFTGRLRGRKLKRGRYRLVATPSAGGKKGKPTSRAFRIVR